MSIRRSPTVTVSARRWARRGGSFVIVEARLDALGVCSESVPFCTFDPRQP